MTNNDYNKLTLLASRLKEYYLLIGFLFFVDIKIEIDNGEYFVSVINKKKIGEQNFILKKMMLKETIVDMIEKYTEDLGLLLLPKYSFKMYLEDIREGLIENEVVSQKSIYYALNEPKFKPDEIRYEWHWNIYPKYYESK
jgi:hypothetical protein